MSEVLEKILAEHGRALWRGMEGPRWEGVESGWPELRDALPGGWPRGALTEVFPSREGIGELRLFLPALARLSRLERRWILWVAPPHVPYAPALAAAGLELSHVLVVHARERLDRFWATEQALASGTCAAVLAWPDPLDPARMRRLQLAAERGRSLGLLFYPRPEDRQPSSAALRVRLVPEGDGLRVDVHRRSGARPARAVLPVQAQLPLALG